MTEEKPSFDDQPGTAQDSWAEVGQQFARLGESIAAAFDSAWQDEATQDYVQQMREGLEKMAGSVAQAVDDAARSSEGQKVRDEAEKAVSNAREASKQAMENARPQVLSALEQINLKMNEMIERMRAAQPGASSKPEAAREAATDPAEEPEDELTDASQVW